MDGERRAGAQTGWRCKFELKLSMHAWRLPPHRLIVSVTDLVIRVLDIPGGQVLHLLKLHTGGGGRRAAVLLKPAGRCLRILLWKH